MKTEQPIEGAAVNEKSFFATSESVGVYWDGVRRGRRRYDQIKGTGALQKSKPPQGIVVVNPAK